MKFSILLVTVFVCLCAQEAESKFFFRRFFRRGNFFNRVFNIRIRNAVTTPNFDMTISVSRQRLFNALTRAATDNNSFRFSTDFNRDTGFVITALNGVENDETNEWRVFNAANATITTRLERFLPDTGTTILFDFVART